MLLRAVMLVDGEMWCGPSHTCDIIAPHSDRLSHIFARQSLPVWLSTKRFGDVFRIASWFCF